MAGRTRDSARGLSYETDAEVWYSYASRAGYVSILTSWLTEFYPRCLRRTRDSCYLVRTMGMLGYGRQRHMRSLALSLRERGQLSSTVTASRTSGKWTRKSTRSRGTHRFTLDFLTVYSTLETVPRTRHIPRPVYKAAELKRTMLDAQRVKEERRRKHTRAGESKPKAERKKIVVAEQT